MFIYGRLKFNLYLKWFQKRNYFLNYNQILFANGCRCFGALISRCTFIKTLNHLVGHDWISFRTGWSSDSNSFSNKLIMLTLFLKNVTIFCILPIIVTSSSQFCRASVTVKLILCAMQWILGTPKCFTAAILLGAPSVVPPLNLFKSIWNSSNMHFTFLQI